jgi:CheY-like chemotaxis protein
VSGKLRSIMSDDTSPELKLAEAVAERTAVRVREGIREELDTRDAALRDFWRLDLGQLRDDLTAKSLLAHLKEQPSSDIKKTPVKVLVVDDYPETLRAFMKIFASYGMEPMAAHDGRSAAELLDDEPAIEVVVADISMPKNGYTLLDHIRKNFPIIEVVMTSGYETEVRRARELGAFAFLPKPFQMEQAVLLVERAAEFRRLKLAATSKG